MKITLEPNDLILIQTVLNSKKYITLTTDKIIITKEQGVSSIFHLEGFENLELNIINTKTSTVSVDNGSRNIDLLTFILKKLDTDQIMLIDKSSQYSLSHGSGNKLTNLLNLLWILAKNNSNIINSMKGIDSALIFTDTITKSSLEKLTAELNNIKSSDEDVEFVD